MIVFQYKYDWKKFVQDCISFNVGNNWSQQTFIMRIFLCDTLYLIVGLKVVLKPTVLLFIHF